MNPTRKQIELFLQKVDTSFPVPLSEKQELFSYARKLNTNATLCCEYHNEDIISMVAGYTDHVKQNMGYISIVATLEKARGQGLASKLVREFLEIAHRKGLEAVHLYAVSFNIPAVKMYEKLGFTVYSCPNEPRPGDLHLIYYFEE